MRRTLASTLVCAGALVGCQRFLDFGETSVVIYVGGDGGGGSDGGVATDAGILSDAAAPPCVPGTCVPERLLSQSGLYGVAVDDTTIYLSRYDEGQLVTLPLDAAIDTTPTMRVSGLSYPVHLAVDATHIYVGSDNGGLTRVVAIRKTFDAPPVPLAFSTASCFGVALGTDGGLCYTERSPTGSNGGSIHFPLGVREDPLLFNPAGIGVAANGDMYVASSMNDTVFVYASDGGSKFAAPGIKAPAGVAADDSHWWVTSQDQPGKILRGALGEAQVTAYSVPTELRPAGIAVTKTAVYFVTRSNPESAALWRLPK